MSRSGVGVPELPRIVSLFCGAGGLDKGFEDAGFKISVAVDSSEAAIATHKANFYGVDACAADLLRLGPDGVLALVAQSVPRSGRIGVIGGPPCQGFSRANTGSRADDPRNELPALYLQIIERLQSRYKVEFVLFENVLGIKDSKHSATFDTIVEGLGQLRFDVTERELCALDFGVPQNRRRILLIGMRKRRGYAEPKLEPIDGMKTVREAIGGLPAPAFFARDLTPETIPHHPNHWTMQARSPRFSLPISDRRGGRSFRQLEWDAPSPTVAYGHREIHVHPLGTRRLSIYEAMLLQGFSSSFELKGTMSEQVDQVSNAVPPPMARGVADAIARAIRG